jgi:general secretion pathway protein C
MSPLFLKHYKLLYLLLPIALGLALGHLAATGAGIFLTPPAQQGGATMDQVPVATRKPVLQEYQRIVERNIFDSTAKPVVALETEEAPAVSAAPMTRSDLTLFGTVVRAEESLAVIRSSRDVRTYKLGAELQGGGVVDTIERNTVQIRYANGSTQTLSLREEETSSSAAAAPPPATARGRGAAAPPAPAQGAGGEIRAVGENRWVIPQQVAAQARGNLNELLRQARMEPNMVNGQTQGFVVRMIQPRSLLALLGIQRGDVLHQINGVELDSPEKALQIFQQLREARSISIALQRGGNNMTFQYEVE